mmetsp:Transcript_34924/g.90485  ORF Transcript_34924/g.90485 Transcript_34924/m.90485 type:complete len:271 (-) Transcript_34924:124-936(-)
MSSHYFLLLLTSTSPTVHLSFSAFHSCIPLLLHTHTHTPTLMHIYMQTCTHVTTRSRICTICNASLLSRIRTVSNFNNAAAAASKNRRRTLRPIAESATPSNDLSVSRLTDVSSTNGSSVRIYDASIRQEKLRRDASMKASPDKEGASERARRPSTPDVKDRSAERLNSTPHPFPPGMSAKAAIASLQSSSLSSQEKVKGGESTDRFYPEDASISVAGDIRSEKPERRRSETAEPVPEPPVDPPPRGRMGRRRSVEYEDIPQSLLLKYRL